MKRLLMLAAAGLIITGCGSPNVNPSRARAKTGYVDFYVETSANLCWQVARFDARSQTFKAIFEDFSPLEGRVLRLAFAPGSHRLQVTFINRLIGQPAEVDVEVQDGKITPVRLTLSETGTALVKSKEASNSGSINTRYRRGVKIGIAETATEAISAVGEAPVAYQLKERMPYAR